MEILAAFARDSRILRLGKERPDLLSENTLDYGPRLVLASHVKMHLRLHKGVFRGPRILLGGKASHSQNDIWRASHGTVSKSWQRFSQL